MILQNICLLSTIYIWGRSEAESHLGVWPLFSILSVAQLSSWMSPPLASSHHTSHTATVKRCLPVRSVGVMPILFPCARISYRPKRPWGPRGFHVLASLAPALKFVWKPALVLDVCPWYVRLWVWGNDANYVMLVTPQAWMDLHHLWQPSFLQDEPNFCCLQSEGCKCNGWKNPNPPPTPPRVEASQPLADLNDPCRSCTHALGEQKNEPMCVRIEDNWC